MLRRVTFLSVCFVADTDFKALCEQYHLIRTVVLWGMYFRHFLVLFKETDH